jgi:hypothetical protein
MNKVLGLTLTVAQKSEPGQLHKNKFFVFSHH